MVSIAGSKKLKRQMAPIFWGITRKNKRFVVTVKPGPHKKKFSIPTAVLLRDTLKFVETLREAKAVIYGGKIKVDGVLRKSIHHPIGLMDVVELEGISEIFRLVPMNGSVLKPLKITDSEKTRKICKVISKNTIKNGKTQIGLHDGRTIITDIAIKVGDSCLIQVPEQKIIEVLTLEKGCYGLVTKGVNAGQMGKINDIDKGTFSLPRRVNISLGERQIDIPEEIVLTVGKEKPVIQIK